MNSSNFTDDLCGTAEYLSKNVQLRVMLWIRIAIAIIGLLLFAVLFRVQGRYLTVHQNAQILLNSHHVWVVLQCATSLIGHVYALLRYNVYHANSCDYLIPAPVAILIRGPIWWCTYGQVWAFASMAVERLVATIQYQSYETKTAFLAKVAIPIEWLLSTLWLFLAIRNTDWSQMRAHSTVTTSNNNETMACLLFVLAGVEIIACSIFFLLYILNKRHRMRLQAYATLTEKYQLDENIRAISIMSPMVLTHFCCFMPQLIAFPIYYTIIDPDVRPRDYIPFMETFSISPFYCIILPAVLFWRHKTLRKNLRAVFRMNITVAEYAVTAEGRTQEQIRHFEMLKQIWNSGSKYGSSQNG